MKIVKAMHRKPILQIIRKIFCSRNYFPVLSHITVLFSFRPFVYIHIQIRVIIREIKTFAKSTRKQGSEK